MPEQLAAAIRELAESNTELAKQLKGARRQVKWLLMLNALEFVAVITSLLGVISIHHTQGSADATLRLVQSVLNPNSPYAKNQLQNEQNFIHHFDQCQIAATEIGIADQLH